MTEAEPATIPVTNGTKEYISKDIEKFQSRIQVAIKKTESPSSPNILPNTDSIPNAISEEPIKKLDVLDDQPLTPANKNDEAKATIEGDSVECYCQKLSINPGTASCSKCERVVPALVDLHKQ